MRICVSLVSALVVLTAIVAGCGGGGAGSGSALLPAQTGAQISLTAAMALPMATNPVAGSAANVTRLSRLQNEANVPDTVAELKAELQFWTTAVKANANDSAAQLGLSLAIAGCAGQNSAYAVGESLFRTTSVARLARSAVGADLAPERLMSDALAAFTAAKLPPLRGTTGEAPAVTPGELRDYRAAIQTYLLPPLAHVQERLTRVADRAPTTRKLMTLTVDGTQYTVYSADFRATAVAFGLARCALLMVTSIDPSYGAYNWDRTLIQRDTNKDGKLTRAEYVPAPPFANLTAATWTSAGAVLREAVSQAGHAVDDVTADAKQVLRRVMADVDRAEVRANLADALTMLSGSVNVTVTAIPVTTATARAAPGSGEAAQTVYTVPCNLRQLWDTPPTNLCSLLPPLYLMLDDGAYKTATGTHLFSVELERVGAAGGTYRVWPASGAPSRTGSIAMTTAPHPLAIGASGGFPGINGSFNWNWVWFTGTYAGVARTLSDPSPSVSGLCRWADLPDPTISGAFPSPAQMKTLIYGNWSSVQVKYRSIVLGESASGAAVRRSPPA